MYNLNGEEPGEGTGVWRGVKRRWAHGTAPNSNPQQGQHWEWVAQGCVGLESARWTHGAPFSSDSRFRGATHVRPTTPL
jgi:hypothetical protein